MNVRKVTNVCGLKGLNGFRISTKEFEKKYGKFIGDFGLITDEGEFHGFIISPYGPILVQKFMVDINDLICL